jgi:hypothetical protein
MGGGGMKFRKKPVEIEAVQITEQGVLTIPEWLEHAMDNGFVLMGITMNGCVVYIYTLEGVMIGFPGDWIIRGVKGELYPCKPDIFDATYEAVIEDA